MGIRQGRSMRLLCRSAAAVTLCAVTALTADTATAQDLATLAQKVGVRVLAEATSDRDVMAWSRQRLPYPQMSPGARDRASRILANTSQYRRMPSLQYPVDPNMYQYLINHPDVAVSTWRAMGISKLQMSQKSRFEYEAQAIDGSDGIADVLWRDGNQCLFIVEGRYNSPVLPSSINASALVWLQYRFVRNRQGEIVVNQQVETFVHFHSAAIETIARLASRITNSILDRNVFEVSLYARMMSQAGQRDPQWISEVAARLDGVPASRRVELVRVSRGLKPYGVNAVVRQKPSDSAAVLHMSQQFRDFSQSMQQVQRHVPLVSAPQTPPNGTATATAQAGTATLRPGNRVAVSGTAENPITSPASAASTPAEMRTHIVSQTQPATTEEVATPFLKEAEYAEPLIPPAVEHTAAPAAASTIPLKTTPAGKTSVQPPSPPRQAASPLIRISGQQTDKPPVKSASGQTSAEDTSAEDTSAKGDAAGEWISLPPVKCAD